jgi:hypothetical protein
MTSSADARPAVWVGHLVLQARDLDRSYAYWSATGMRPLLEGNGFAILELRGGTHLVLAASDEDLAPGTPAPFDLMVEDLAATHARYSELDLGPSEISHDPIHDSFTLTDPNGYVVTVNSTHVSDLPV